MDMQAILGRYWPSSSAVHRLDARTKLIAMLALIILLFIASSFWAIGIVAAFVLASFAVARIPVGVVVRSVLPLLLIVVITALFNIIYVGNGDVLADWGWLRITSGGLLSAAYMSTRLLLFLLLGSLLTLTTTTIDITNAIEALLSPLSKIGLPIGEFAFVMGTALRFLPQFASEFRNIRTAQDARGARLSTSPKLGTAVLASFVVPLFASVFRHADTLAAAMESRCYVPGRSLMRRRRRPLGKSDVACLLLIAALAIAVTWVSLATR